MGFRFRKSIRLAPGVRLNFGSRGASWTLGGRGASIGIGPRGTYLNTSIPGTGISARQRLSGASSPSVPARRQALLDAARLPNSQTAPAKLQVGEDGSITLLNSEGTVIPEVLVQEVRRQQPETWRTMMQAVCDVFNEPHDLLATVHEDTPRPQPPTFEPQPFPEDEPPAPALERGTLWTRLWKNARIRLDARNARLQAEHAQAIEAYTERRQAHAAAEARRRHTIEQAIHHEVPAMEAFLSEWLSAIEWPRETLVSFELLDNGRRLLIDVDLPEIEQMPSATASVPARGHKLTIRELSEAKVRRLYATHVHAVGFRVIGEAFAALPTVQTIELGAYSQRTDKATGSIEDEYLYAVRVSRQQWQCIDFTNLGAIDCIEALDRFELRRRMFASMIFKSIEPLRP